MSHKRRMLGLALAVLFSAGAMVPMQASAGNGPLKATVCHKGNTLEVGLAAAAAHLAHGDSLGACGSSFPPE